MPMELVLSGDDRLTALAQFKTGYGKVLWLTNDVDSNLDGKYIIQNPRQRYRDDLRPKTVIVAFDLGKYNN